jgi:hypothetical protein
VMRVGACPDVPPRILGAVGISTFATSPIRRARQTESGATRIGGAR